MVGIRGAITVDDNTREAILKGTKQLLQEILSVNTLKVDDIVSIIFTTTDDLDAAYPAIAARELDITHGGLLCMQEMKVQDSLRMCIRVLVYTETSLTQKDVQHIYLEGARSLRPDLCQ